MSAAYPISDSARRMARLAGLSYLAYTLAGFYITFGPIPSLSAVAGDTSLTQTLDTLFRSGFLAETVLYTFVCVSAAAMYAVLSPVSRGLALTAAFCRLIESALGATFILFKYAAFTAAVNPDLTPGFSDEQRASLVDLLRDIYGSGLYVLLIPMAVGGILYFSLFFRARLIPRWLSGWGVFTYAMVGTVSALVLLFPALRDQVMIFFLPGALFEWVAALWLLFAGIKIRNETQTAT
ncbi:DUF4386 domain-containing protein [Maricaulis virginensis]|jgi:hypothetical protein|uniref:DUF4386 domain-containing protein n=1 Tax=Maricaulis virginensis TaxID=144022 RepID=A0A9W6MQE3_9PROT|nr:DUF4386 domain-containing protein [Maricaulis virginensis]GLK53924.1 hypothetical protein GCM10017621_34320 [Maricaulis virginensis]